MSTNYVRVAIEYQQGKLPFADGLDADGNQIDSSGFLINSLGDHIPTGKRTIVSAPITYYETEDSIPPSKADSWYPITYVYGPSIDHATQVWNDSTEFTDDGVTVTHAAVDKPLADLKVMYSDEVTARRYGYENDGFYYNGYWYETNRNVRPILLSTVWTEGLAWKTRSGDLVTHTSESFSELKNKINSFVQAAFTQEASLLAAIKSTTTNAAVIAIDKNAGWPDRFYPDAPPAPTPVMPMDLDPMTGLALP
jgi:hypothetical protein